MQPLLPRGFMALYESIFNFNLIIQEEHRYKLCL